MTEWNVRQALNDSLGRVRWTELDTARVLRSVRDERAHREDNRPVRRLRGGRLLAVALVTGLLLASMTAVGAQTGLGRMTTATVALEQRGEVWTEDWPLESRMDFVQAMRDAGLTMDEDDWTILSDAGRTAEERAAAADRIIDARYGDLMREEAAGWVQQVNSVEGMAPDVDIIFKEQWLREHPDSDSATVTQSQAYWDDYIRYMEQVYAPQVSAAKANQTPEPEMSPREKAIDWLRSYMTEVKGWSPDAVYDMEPEVDYDETYRLWVVSGTVSASSMQVMADSGLEPATEGPGITRTESGDYTLTLLVSEDGSQATYDGDRAAFREKLDSAIPAALTTGEAFALAEEALKGTFGLNEGELELYFMEAKHGWEERDGEYWMEIRCLNHVNVWDDYDYGVLVNITRGTVEKVWPA